MEIELKNIGLIDHCKVKIDGITVISGGKRNRKKHCGKSFVWCV